MRGEYRDFQECQERDTEVEAREGAADRRDEGLASPRRGCAYEPTPPSWDVPGSFRPPRGSPGKGRKYTGSTRRMVRLGKEEEGACLQEDDWRAGGHAGEK